MSQAGGGWSPSGDAIRAARERTKNYVTLTPLLRAEGLDQKGFRVWVKPENLQRTGSFKVRGAFNAVAALNPETRTRGVVAFSSGNHAQAVALAARELGMAERGEAYPCTVVMPEGASSLKVERTKNLGAEVVFCGKTVKERQMRAAELAHESGRAVIPSYDHPEVISGQGTLGTEILDQWMGAPSRTRRLGLVAGPIGGGGLMAGTAAGLRARGFSNRIIGVEPEAADDTRKSMEAGQRVEIPLPETVCDSLMSTTPGALTFPVLQKCKVEVRTTSEAAIKNACVWLLNELKLLVEPGGGVAVAAWLEGRIDPREGLDPAIAQEAVLDAVLILSGGNVEPSVVAGWTP